ncbi:MAG: class I SAM-dependent methyltransferase [Eubacteriaceae bacterium]
MNKIKDHFESEAIEFDKIILDLIPYYSEMIDALILAIPFKKEETFKVIDLGCGTGNIAQKVMNRFPNAQITCLDLAENMISMAKIKLKKHNNIKFIVNDFNKLSFETTYDVVVSSLSLHHLISDKDKKIFYGKIYDALTDRGVFYNADVVLGTNNYLQGVYMKKWKEYMIKNILVEEIEKKWIPKYNEEDSPAKLINHILWLEEVGFKSIDVIWKYYNFAVYGGCKENV